ncbi:MAG: radical SAM protein [Thermodesulfobacteriota bacterium]
MKEPLPRTVRFRPGERNVFLHLLTACNLACRHCYINPSQHGTSILSPATAVQWLGSLAAPGRETNLVLLGGEPTLHPELPAIIHAARGLGYRSITVDTNGFLFHEFLDRVGPAALDFLSFSLDGPDATVNDPIRGEGVFATCTTNLREAVHRGFTVSLIFTVSRLNLSALAAMPPLLAAWGVSRFFIQVIGIRGKPAVNGQESLQLSPQEWLAAVPPVASAAARLGIHTVFPKVFLDSDEPFQCAGAVADNLFVFPNGRVYRCPLCEDYPVHAFVMKDGRLEKQQGLTEDRFFGLAVPEGCVMHRLLQPGNLEYDEKGRPVWRVSCCLLKQEIPAGG